MSHDFQASFSHKRKELTLLQHYGFPQGDLKAKESESRNKRMIAPTCESSAFHEWGDDTQNLTYMNQPPLFPSTFITSDKEPYDNIMTTNVQNVEILNKRYAFRVPVVDTIDSLWQLYSHSCVLRAFEATSRTSPWR